MCKSKEEIELIAKQLVDSMLAVHRELGPGLLESTYQACLAYELGARGIEVRCEVELPVKYKGLEIEAGYRIDMLVADCIVWNVPLIKMESSEWSTSYEHLAFISLRPLRLRGSGQGCLSGSPRKPVDPRV